MSLIPHPGPEQVCRGNAASLPVVGVEGFNSEDVDCSDPERVGPPTQADGRWSSGWCKAEEQISMQIAGRFVYTLVFNVLLLSCAPRRATVAPC